MRRGGTTPKKLRAFKAAIDAKTSDCDPRKTIKAMSGEGGEGRQRHANQKELNENELREFARRSDSNLR